MKTRILRWLTMPMTLLALSAALAACNTIEGAGEDVSAAGDAVSNTAERAKR